MLPSIWIISYQILHSIEASKYKHHIFFTEVLVVYQFSVFQASVANLNKSNRRYTAMSITGGR